MNKRMIATAACLAMTMFVPMLSAADEAPKAAATAAEAAKSSEKKITMDDIKKNMIARKPKLDKLKKAGSIGETLGGFLEAMKDAKLSAEETKQIADENEERKLIYAEIAKKESTTVSKVGELRAKKIYSTAEEGTFIQNKDGKWEKAPAPKKEEKK